MTLVQGPDGEVTGTIRLSGEFYLVRPLIGSLHALVDVDESKYPSGGDSPRHDGGSSQVDSQSASPSKTLQSAKGSSGLVCAASAKPLGNGRSSAPNDGSRSEAQSAAPAPCTQGSAKVLVLYTSAAANGRDIYGLMNTAIQEANDAYSNSNAYDVYLTLAHSQRVNINDIGVGDIEDDLGDLQSSSTVQSLRDQHDADVVVLLTDNGYFTPRGQIQGIVDEIRAEAGDAYAIVEAPYATGGEYTFTHDVGHLQGAQHNPQIACHPANPSVSYPACDKEGDFFSDAYGHRFVDEGWCGWLCDVEYATMMADNDDDHSRVKHFPTRI